ncbi:Hypothetical predicted protein [Olea europaea subsp. europaea]|uniref:Uncharacterized protein n=1 Tax=Olea europaea subsp. europaea TaxID=158383 RepID=A0A8S0U8B2_OLEEU|nr:Hypothetical predicted protein [Olea europaea subsp. europaea]
MKKEKRMENPSSYCNPVVVQPCRERDPDKIYRPRPTLTLLNEFNFQISWLPSNFDDLRLCVTWMRKGDLLTTHPARVCEGMAEFKETLMHWCTVYGCRNGPEHSSKYEPKLSLLHVSVTGAPAHDWEALD